MDKLDTLKHKLLFFNQEDCLFIFKYKDHQEIVDVNSPSAVLLKYLYTEGLEDIYYILKDDVKFLLKGKEKDYLIEL